MSDIKAYANVAPPNDINKFDAILKMCNQIKEKTNTAKFLVTCNDLEFTSLKSLAPVCEVVKDFTEFPDIAITSYRFKCQLGGNEVVFTNFDVPGTSDLIYVIPLIEEPNYEEETREETDESTAEDY